MSIVNAVLQLASCPNAKKPSSEGSGLINSSPMVWLTPTSLKCIDGKGLRAEFALS